MVAELRSGEAAEALPAARVDSGLIGCLP